MTVDGGLRPLFRRKLPDLAWTSVETGGTGQGIADSNYLARGGVEGWVEFKQTTGWTVTLKPEQAAWLDQRDRYGGRAWIAVRRHSPGGPRSQPSDSLYMLPARLAVAARTGGLRAPDVASAAESWHGGPARWDWGRVRELLLQAPF